MTSAPVLFEISWEVCNKVGGIHTVLSTKAKTAVETYGDDYIAVGPWLLSESNREVPFDDEPGHEDFCETCRSQGVPVRVGRWRMPGRPRTILVEFSRLYEHKDDVLSDLWERYKVDSISGGWDYSEPVLFGHAAGIVIECWWEEHLAPKHRRAVVHAHEWMTGSALLYLKTRLPSIGTVFTTHATMLGRALSSLGHSPSEGLGDKTAEDLAEENQVTAKHSIEGVCAREADVFTTVSQITAAEAELLHARRPDPVLPNGIDLSVVDAIAGDADRDTVRAQLVAEASRFFGEDVGDAALLAVSGRYEFHNKGIDLLLESLAEVNRRDGQRIVLFVLVPAGNSGIRSEVLERRHVSLDQLAQLDGPVAISTHNLFEEERDPIHQHCNKVGIDNAKGRRVKVVHIPIYLDEHDGFLDRPYEAVLRAMDLTCFPSYYEPWGYTPQESLAVGVPTITSDYAGFGRWARGEGLGVESGIAVLAREKVSYPEAVTALDRQIEEFLTSTQRPDYASCRATAGRTAWSDLFTNYRTAYGAALEAVAQRGKAGAVQTRRPRQVIPVQTAKASTPRLTSFEVVATLPDDLKGLRRLANNYWWSWDRDAAELFADLDPELWGECRHNPVALLQRVEPADLTARAADAEYRGRVAAALERLDRYLAKPADWSLEQTSAAGAADRDVTQRGRSQGALSAEHPIAYFSAEFGIHESLPIYSGGLGVLAGDHLKSASDLGLPLLGIGLFYRLGYMQQKLTAAGEQTEVDRVNDPREMPMEPVCGAEGAPLEIKIQLPGRELVVRAWRVRVGSVSLYLLDTDTPTNRAEDREITSRLYGGAEEMRILQEIVLGRGGARLIRRLGLHPAVYHMNEGHAAFLALERVSRLVREEGLTFGAAREIVRATTVFTTHTPVPAGHDRFSEELMRRYFSDAEEWVGVPWDRFFDLGRGEDGQFNMTYLACSFASHINGVSKLHGVASRKLLKPFWPGLLEEEIPIHTVTNGIHLPTWSHPRIAAALGASAESLATGADYDRLATKAKPRALWTEKCELKRALIRQAKANLERSFVARNDSPLTLHRILEGLDPEALMIGFARRFAPYKRAHLLFADIERLRRILADVERPVRVLIAGKAHPRDQAGKDILKHIVGDSRADNLIGKVIFLEDYDMDLARALVQGVDVWLNNPTRMQEASGTSGMKAAANGGLNLSIGDGWWPEAADEKNGWTIGGARVYADQELQDQFDSAVLYRLLEEEIVPLFFDRGRDGVPKGWVERMLHDLATIPPMFNTGRMVREYFEQAYRPLARSYFDHVQDRKSRAKSMADDARRIRNGFASVKVVEAQIADLREIKVGESIDVRLDVDLGSLAAGDVRVELVLGNTRDAAQGEMRNIVSIPLEPIGSPDGNGTMRFEGSHRMDGAGHFAHGLRVRARHGEDCGGTLKDLVFWA